MGIGQHAALGPGQQALRILALHLPQLTGQASAPRPAETPAAMSPDQAVYEALVSSLQGAPVGGHPTTGPMVSALSDLPTLTGSAEAVPATPADVPMGAGAMPDSLGVGPDQLGATASPVSGGSHIGGDVWRHLISTLGRVGAPR